MLWAAALRIRPLLYPCWAEYEWVTCTSGEAFIDVPAILAFRMTHVLQTFLYSASMVTWENQGAGGAADSGTHGGASSAR